MAAPQDSASNAEASRFEKETKEQSAAANRRALLPSEAIPTEKAPEEKGAPDLSFTLTALAVKGSTVFDDKDFRPIYGPYLGKRVTKKELDEIVSQLKALYDKNGYVTTIVYIPEQEVANGKFEIVAAEGRMGELRIEGARSFSSELIQRYFHQAKNKILNLVAVQRDIMRLNQNPDLSVKAVLSGGKEPQTSDVTLKVTDRFPWHFGAGWNNRGTRLLGKQRELVYARSTNVTGRNDTFFANTGIGTWSIGEGLIYECPVTTYGTKLGFSYTYFGMRLGKEFKALKERGGTHVFSPSVSQEMFLSETFQLDADAGFDIKSIRRFADDTVSSNDQIRLPYFGFELTSQDSLFGGGQFIYNPKFVFGTDSFLGGSKWASDKISRVQTGGDFFKYQQKLNRIQAMPFHSQLAVNTGAQLTPDTLPYSEQMTLGGMSSVRGYPEGDYSADTAVEVNAEWSFPSYFIPPDWRLPFADKSLRDSIQPIIFVDYDYGRLNTVNPGERASKNLLGAGGGFKISFLKNVFARFEWAKALGDKPTSNAGPSTFYFSVQSEI